MYSTLFSSLLATFFISLISFIGLFSISLNKEFLQRILLVLVAFSAGTLLATTFFHLLPETVHEFGEEQGFLYVLVSFVAFLFLEKIIHWHHCHDNECHEHSYGYVNILGDAIHNFIDGLLIGAAFLVSPSLGLVTTLAVAAHEIPQEIGDFAVLLQAGFSRQRALFLNFLSAATAIVGALVIGILGEQVEFVAHALVPMAAGAFLYISASDLLPEIKRENKLALLLRNFLAFVFALIFMYILTQLLPGHVE